MNRDIMWVIFFLLLVGVAWSMQRSGDFAAFDTGGVRLEPAGRQNSGLSSPSPSVRIQNPSNHQAPTNGGAPTQQTPLSDLLYLGQGAARQNNPQKEYIELRASYFAKKPIAITGLKLQNKKNKQVEIPKGTELAYAGKVNSKSTIYLEPGDRAIITTGKNQIDTSFRVNKCSGYFNQFQNFEPYLANQCPFPRDELERANLDFDDECFEYVSRLPFCQMPLENIPLNLSNDCRDFLSAELTYSGCVDAHRQDSDFYKKEWRIYLGLSDELWANSRETIKLLDSSGNLINELSY